MHNRNGICLLVDILGFSKIVESLNDNELDKRINEWVDLVRSLTNKYSITKYNLLSDTLFVNFDNDLSKTIKFSKELIEKSTFKCIPLRGAATFGEIIFGDFIYGKAVIKAHKLEMNQKWIGIVFDRNIPDIENYYGHDKLLNYAVPMKSGYVKVYPVLSWEVPEVIELVKCLNGPGLNDKEHRICQNVLEILTNTSIFKTQRNLKKVSNDNFKEPGHPPSHFVEQLEKIILNLK